MEGCKLEQIALAINTAI